jgi:hypothetical protein
MRHHVIVPTAFSEKSRFNRAGISAYFPDSFSGVWQAFRHDNRPPFNRSIVHSQSTEGGQSRYKRGEIGYPFAIPLLSQLSLTESSDFQDRLVYAEIPLARATGPLPHQDGEPEMRFLRSAAPLRFRDPKGRNVIVRKSLCELEPPMRIVAANPVVIEQSRHHVALRIVNSLLECER